MKRTPRRPVAALAVAAPLVLAVAAPAAAAPPDRFTSKTSGGQANVQWTELDPGDLLGLPGNTHLGFLSVYQQPGFSDVSGQIDDFQCDPGEVPGGGHGGEPGAGQCDLLGTRFLQGLEDIAYTVDLRAGVATLTGRVQVSNGGHGEPGNVLAVVPAAVTWTSVGSTYTFRRTDTWSDGTATFSSATRGTGFQATVSGSLGRMGFADDVDDVSFGSAEQWQERSRSRIG